MESTWRRCPRCTGGRVPVARGRSQVEATVFEALPGDSVGATVVRGVPRQALAPEPSAGPALVATAGPLTGQDLPLAFGKVRIGKDPRPAPSGARPEDTWAVISIPGDRYMSKEHAVLTVGSAALVLADAGSTNGTFVNGVQVPRAVLQDGDEVRMGESVFKVRLPQRD
jgi:hypothetical protein